MVRFLSVILALIVGTLCALGITAIMAMLAWFTHVVPPASGTGVDFDLTLVLSLAALCGATYTTILYPNYRDWVHGLYSRAIWRRYHALKAQANQYWDVAYSTTTPLRYGGYDTSYGYTNSARAEDMSGTVQRWFIEAVEDEDYTLALRWQLSYMDWMLLAQAWRSDKAAISASNALVEIRSLASSAEGRIADNLYAKARKALA